MKNYEGLSSAEIIRRLKDRNSFLELRNKKLIIEEKNRLIICGKLFNFMTSNDLWSLYNSQNKNKEDLIG